ncbi:MAG: HD domain-containing protein, partial [Actinomycetota bacterium]|nr:HD domain-containing protein [Actinomycetota bacterium]
MTSRHGWVRGLMMVAVGLLLLAPLVYLLVLALQGEQLIGVHLGLSTRVTSHNPKLWLILALVGGLAALVGWGLTERARRRLDRSSGDLVASEEQAREQQRQAEQRLRESERHAQQRLQESERQRQAAEREREQEHEERERERERAHEEHEQYAQAWDTQRRWNRQLRERIAELQQQQGILGRLDVHDMVLRLTVELVESEKGILLARRGHAGDELEVVSSAGFEHDAADSALARRFAGMVIERDCTVREDSSAEMESSSSGSAADEEVRNILAIPIYLREDFHGVIVCANRKGGFESLDDDVLLAVGDHAGAVLENSRLHGELRGAYLQTVRTLSSVIEVKDPDLRGHSDAVAEYVMRVADRLGFEPHRREELVFGALLHDVGKIGISERILLKPAALTPEEYSVMQLHPRIGYHLIRQIPALEPIAPAILHHHERFDGTGYPGRLRGETIPIAARIIAVADAFSAMTTPRPYREPVSVEHACTELERCAGQQFDPEVVRLFVAEVRRRPPDQLSTEPAAPDPELEVHRQPGSFVLGSSTFGIVDSLTMLYSHRHFHETAAAEAQRAELQERPFGIVVACLDDLETLNREHGFAAGDAALQEVGGVFRRAAARVEGTAFRVSGNKIGMIVSGLDQPAVERLAEDVSEELVSGPAGAVGVATWEPGEGGEQTVQRALLAVRQAEAPVLVVTQEAGDGDAPRGEGDGGAPAPALAPAPTPASAPDPA